jgi:hypothetical protein
MDVASAPGMPVAAIRVTSESTSVSVRSTNATRLSSRSMSSTPDSLP